MMMKNEWYWNTLILHTRVMKSRAKMGQVKIMDQSCQNKENRKENP